MILEHAYLLLLVALIGKFCVSAVFSVSLLFISELYPTTIRNTGLGTSLAVSQIGSVIAPYIVEILVMKFVYGNSEIKFWKLIFLWIFQGAKAWYIPSTVCGALGIFVSSLVLMLPETKGTVLPDTLEDMKNTNSAKVTNCCEF